MGLVLGIDTSCYTTSLALLDTGGGLVADQRKLLDVPAGARGLQQSNAVFQHIQNIKNLFDNLWEIPGRRKLILGVAASVRPRLVEGSYMPVFTVAESYGRTLAGLLGVPFIPTSHQEGHIMAGLWSIGIFPAREFLAVHLSGGTTEVLRVTQQGESADMMFDIRLLGGTKDLNAGQFIDRIGVALGLPFPAGPELEKLARRAAGAISIPSSVHGLEISFSGPETMAQRLISSGADAAEVARGVEQCIANSLEKALRRAIEQTGVIDILLVGGVTANYYIRSRLRERLEHRAVGARLFFAEPSMSSDNAVGVAAIGLRKLKASPGGETGSYPTRIKDKIT
ncbi:tRNA (adenosine(37)-N6)-threonylcarbamoyltransferase complex transferase subunit TsaD [Thermincola potens]|uniref:N(6)-L-threonylcarbamoyladenine synthase n=1 Tax=Thermincola potens (strain JR) TaxID=635013 RepID=D5X7J3_THEPJ|nr:O-sialoglycoprotein endopeptidase [Thermincola potens]ADG82563.1 peptidase M22 glycoprotease [Thermincola potens JR]